MLSSMFTHDPSGWTHIGGNMLFLWIFGDNVEDALGHGRYLALLPACGLAAAMTQIAHRPVLDDPDGRRLRAPSPACSPRTARSTRARRSRCSTRSSRLWLFFGLFLELPAWFVIGEFFVLNLWNAARARSAARAAASPSSPTSAGSSPGSSSSASSCEAAGSARSRALGRLAPAPGARRARGRRMRSEPPRDRW